MTRETDDVRKGLRERLDDFLFVIVLAFSYSVFFTIILQSDDLLTIAFILSLAFIETIFFIPLYLYLRKH